MTEENKWARHQQAHALAEQGMTLKAIGEQIGVSSSRVSAMLHEYDRHIKARNIWYYGLPRKAINLFVTDKHITSREEFHQLFSDGFQFVPGRLQTMVQISKASIEPITPHLFNQVREWLDLPHVEAPLPPKAHKKRGQATLQQAIEKIEKARDITIYGDAKRGVELLNEVLADLRAQLAA